MQSIFLQKTRSGSTLWLSRSSGQTHTSHFLTPAGAGLVLHLGHCALACDQHARADVPTVPGLRSSGIPCRAVAQRGPREAPLLVFLRELLADLPCYGAEEFLFSVHHHWHVLFSVFMVTALLTGLGGTLSVILARSSVIAKLVGHLFMYLLTICIFAFACLLIGLLVWRC